MENNLDFSNDRDCPIYGKQIDDNICYETAMCLQGLFKLSSVPESKDIMLDYDTAKRICNACPYSNME